MQTRLLHIWEVEDIRAGMVVQAENCMNPYMVGYHVNGSISKYVLIDPRDGAIFKERFSKKTLAVHLTEKNFRVIAK